MPRPIAVRRPGAPKAVPLKLPDELAIDLQAFCEAHFNTAQNQVICAAVRLLIDSELASDPVAHARFSVAKARILQSRSVADGKRLELVTPPERRPT